MQRLMLVNESLLHEHRERSARFYDGLQAVRQVGARVECFCEHRECCSPRHSNRTQKPIAA